MVAVFTFFVPVDLLDLVIKLDVLLMKQVEVFSILWQFFYS